MGVIGVGVWCVAVLLLPPTTHTSYCPYSPARRTTRPAVCTLTHEHPPTHQPTLAPHTPKHPHPSPHLPLPRTPITHPKRQSSSSTPSTHRHTHESFMPTHPPMHANHTPAPKTPHPPRPIQLTSREAQISARVRYPNALLRTSRVLPKRIMTIDCKLTWPVLGGDPAARSHWVEQFTAL